MSAYKTLHLNSVQLFVYNNYCFHERYRSDGGESIGPVDGHFGD